MKGSRPLPSDCPTNCQGGVFLLAGNAQANYNQAPHAGKNKGEAGSACFPPYLLPEGLQMSTRLTKAAGVYLVSTVVGPGSRRKLPRNLTMVPEGDHAALIKVIVEKAEEARRLFGIEVPERRPVV